MMRKSALAASIAALLTPALAGALGLGNIEVTSSLNEPLQARIPLRGADSGELEELRVALADQQQFERAGLDRIYVLTKLRFEVEQTDARNGVIRISTREPVVEPFLNFLVDVNWPRGRVLREYTVLLDPPVYGSAIRTGTGREMSPVDSAAAAPRTAPAAAPPPRTESAPRMQARTATAPTASRPSAESYGPVREGETLWSIAEQVRPAGVSIQSTMLALLRANPEAFSLDNINALRTGAVLRIPAASEVAGGKAAALEEVARQHALWAEYRQTLSSSVSAQPAPASSTTGAPAAESGAPAPSTGAGTPESSSELKLVGGGSAGSAAGGSADVDALRDELTMAQEESEAARQENAELRSRLGQVETLVDDLKRLVELKEDQLAALQDQLSQAGAAGAGAATPTEPQETRQTDQKAAPMEQPAAQAEPAAPGAAQQQAAAPKPAEPPPRPMPSAPAPKSLLEEIDDMLPFPLWAGLGGLGALVLALGGLRFARGRRSATEASGGAAAAVSPAVDDAATLLDQDAPTETRAGYDEAVTQVPGVADDGTLVEDASGLSVDDELGEKTSSAPGEELDEDDPLAEVNVYLAYERFDQAEQLVRDAIQARPERNDYKLKLLEVFYAAKNVAAFQVAANELRAAVGDGDPMVAQAREWWNDLEPGHALFDGGDEPGVTAESEGSGSGVDFDLGFDEGDAAAASTAALDLDLGGDEVRGGAGSGSSDVDFDLGSLGDDTGQASGGLDFDLSAEEEDDGSKTGLDFDLGSLGEEGEATGSETASTSQMPGPSETGLDFDLGDLEASDDERTAPAGSVTEDDMPLDFDLSDTVSFDSRREEGDTEEAGEQRERAGSSSELDFDLGDTISTAPPGPVADDGNVDDGTELDFDLGDTAGHGVLKSAAGAGSSSELDFDLSDTGFAPDAQGDDGESKLDFDLGDTGIAPGTGTAAQDDDGESKLDFDLGDTGVVPGTGTLAGDDGGESLLDFDLGDTTGEEKQDTSASSGTGGTVDFDLGATGDLGEGSGGVEDLGLDLDLGGDEDRSSSSLDLHLDDGEPTQGSDRARQEGGAPSSTMDTVKLSRRTGTPASDEADSSVDSEFLDIFDDSGDKGDAGGDSVLDFDLGDTNLGSGGADAGQETEFMLQDRDDGGADGTEGTLPLDAGESGQLDEMQTKLDLAQAYMDMGDSDGARNLLGEVMADGDESQQGQAREMLQKLS